MLTAALIYVSCESASASGLSVDDAKKKIEAVPGIEVDYIDLHKFRDGFAETRNVFISVTTVGNSEKISPVAMVDYLVRMAWAVNDLHPNLFIGVVFEPANDASLNWLEAAREAGLEPEASPHSNYVTLSVESASKAFGPWPGPVPELPRQSDGPKTK